MSSCVTGVPLPGWMFSAKRTTYSLPSLSTTLPLRRELAITFTGAILNWAYWRTGCEKPSAAPYTIFRAAASHLRDFEPRDHDRCLALVDAPCPRRPPPATDPAQRHCRAPIRDWFADRDFVEIRDRRPADLARQRDASVGLFDRGDPPRRHAPAALSSHLAGIRLQEAAGRRRNAHLQFRHGLAQPRARPPAPSGIHHDRMVQGGRDL